MWSLEQANALLEAQRREMSGDAHVRREVEPWAALDPAERLSAFAVLCRDAEAWIARLDDPAEIERALAADPLPADAVTILAALRAGGSEAGPPRSGG